MQLFVFIVSIFFSASAVAADSVELPEEDRIDFLYIDANAGEAAGGHTALRLGDSVFHYQFFPDDTFLLVRESWDSFRFLYNDLHNRSLAIAPLPLDHPVASSIRNHFTEILVTQQDFFNEFEALRKEKQLVQQVIDKKNGFPVNCLGFFNREDDFAAQRDVFDEITTEFGKEILSKLFVEASESLQRAVQQLSNGQRLGKRFYEILAWKEALWGLLNGKTLETDTLIRPINGESALSITEKAALESFAEFQVQSIVMLLRSSRPDRGEALLLLMARYLVVQQSLSEGVLYTLDPYFENVRVVQLTDKDVEKGRLLFFQQDILNQANTRRKLFFEETKHLEIAYSLFETSRARAWELSRVSKKQRSVRLLVKTTLPTRPGFVTIDFSQSNIRKLQKLKATLELELFDFQERSEDLYGYNLVWRNCATELIRSLNSAFPNIQMGREALGGWLEPDDGLLFIPFLFYEQAVTAYSLQDEYYLPARRLRNLEELYSYENDLWVWLRESNTLSSTLYEPRDKDTPFLFFTDDSLILRPIQGVFNVVYAALYGVAGVAMVPFDGGAQARQAVRGIFYSLPELAFGNIRKGSYAMAEPLTEESH